MPSQLVSMSLDLFEVDVHADLGKRFCLSGLTEMVLQSVHEFTSKDREVGCANLSGSGGLESWIVLNS